jgi:hypothetical protein
MNLCPPYPPILPAHPTAARWERAPRRGAQRNTAIEVHAIFVATNQIPSLQFFVHFIVIIFLFVDMNCTFFGLT